MLMNSMWLEQDRPFESDNANSVYLVTPKGEGWETEIKHEKENRGTLHAIPISLPVPVRVAKGPDGREELIYNSSVMKLGEIYQVVWNGKPYGVRKTETRVDIMRFYPNRGQGD